MTSPLTSLVKEHTEAGYPAARKNNWLRNLGQVRSAVFCPYSPQFLRGTDNVPKEPPESTPGDLAQLPFESSARAHFNPTPGDLHRRRFSALTADSHVASPRGHSQALTRRFFP